MALDDDNDLALAAASLRANSGDVALLLKALCTQLADTLGARLSIQRAGSRLRKSDEIASVSIAMGNDVFEAVVDGASLRCTVAHSSGGIRIRGETVNVDEWLVRLLGSLQTEAAHSDAARRALENIVIGGHS